jgi:hypothetical protein
MRYLLIVLMAVVAFTFIGCAYPPAYDEPTRVEDMGSSKKIEKSEWKPTLGGE